MNYTYATVIISDADKAQAQADMGEGFFNTPLSASGEEPATNWMSSGPFENRELDMIVNKVKEVTTEISPATETEPAVTETTLVPLTWNFKIAFGQDWQGFVDYLGLKVVYFAQEFQTN